MTVERYCANCGAFNLQEDEHCFACGIVLSAKTHPLALQVYKPQVLLNRYRLRSQVGSGGFSAVYKAEDTTTGKIVAIKAISLRGLTTQEKIEATDTFNREISLLSPLRHRSLPRILDHFSDAECWYMVMDFVDGTSLEQLLEGPHHARLPLTEVIDIGLVLCDVLEYLHAQHPPVIYRDLKPANVILTSHGHLFLIDFGIARIFKPGKARDTIPFGSPGYAAPEQYGKAQTTPRADIYSLGALLHQLLTGTDPAQHPFAFAPVSQRRPELAALEPLITRMVALKSSDRPENIQAVKKELQRFSAQQRVQGQPAQRKQPPRSFQSPSYVRPYQPPRQVLATGSARQVQLQQVMVGRGKKQRSVPLQNHNAVWSLVLALLGGVAPMVVMPLTSSLITDQSFQSTWYLSLSNLTPFALGMFLVHTAIMLSCLIPSVLGIFLGHRSIRPGTPKWPSGYAVITNFGLICSYIFAIMWGALFLFILTVSIKP
ncbi:MAG TPA: serine/threonine-protein kinase [Ktedonosporobacter sp.]|jgi:serine/threonine protein kinase|nr:serine/threonine-protein kinase [Ktedonosporobacter sp.]